MPLYKSVAIPNWQQIQEKFSYLAKPRAEKDWIYLLDKFEIAELSKLLPTFEERKIKSALAFGQGPLDSQEIHVDGYGVNRTRASNAALNIPIVSKGKMTWYHGRYSLEEASTSKVRYLKLNWLDTPTVQDSIIVDSPYVVKIDVPHNVVNLDNSIRVILSIRFSPDISLG